MPVIPFEMSMDLSTVKGGGSGAPGKDGKSAYQVWLDLGNEGTEEDFIDSLEGPAGPEGKQGRQGDAGPVGPAGLTWRHQWNSTTTYQSDDAVGYAGASWFALKESTGNVPNEDASEYWALLASQGARGPEGPQGVQGIQGKDGKSGSFEVDSLTTTQLQNLRAKLKTVTPQKFWAYKGKIQSATGGLKTFPLADTNITFQIKTTSADSVEFSIYATDKATPAQYMVRRFTVYGTASLEGKVTPSYRYQDLTTSTFQIDDYDYADGRSQVIMNIIDSRNNLFYSVTLQMDVGVDTARWLYMEVNKVGEDGYISF